MVTLAQSEDVFRTEVLGLAPDYVDYQDGWARQKEVYQQVLSGGPSTLLVLEHASVYTAGKRTEPHERPTDGTPVVDVDRGGKITWHGPGQLVGYPIYRLHDPKDVRLYVEQLEEALIDVCKDYGILGNRVEGRSGVWLEAEEGRPERKIAAIGIRIHEGVTMHGFALNCSNDLGAYDSIVPCGIADAGVTSISAESGATVTPADVLDRTVAAVNARVRA